MWRYRSIVFGILPSLRETVRIVVDLLGLMRLRLVDLLMLMLVSFVFSSRFRLFLDLLGLMLMRLMMLVYHLVSVVLLLPDWLRLVVRLMTLPD